jgi:hypothetical protein
MSYNQKRADVKFTYYSPGETILEKSLARTEINSLSRATSISVFNLSSRPTSKSGSIRRNNQLKPKKKIKINIYAKPKEYMSEKQDNDDD